jgi:hypothetical protein
VEQFGYKDSGSETEQTNNHRKNRLGDPIFPQTADEFRTDPVTHCEKKEEKEDRFQAGRYRNVELADNQRRNQDAGHAAQRKAGNLYPPNQEAEGNGQINRELGMKSKGGEYKIHVKGD